MKTLMLALTLAVFPLAACGEGIRNVDEAVALTDKVMVKVAADDMSGGLELLKAHSVVPVAEIDAMIGKSELQIPVMQGRFGKSVGYELLQRKAVGDSLFKVIYLHKFEKHATVWNFVFYRSNEAWLLNTFNFKDDLGEVL